jgi:hypothetical protein
MASLSMKQENVRILLRVDDSNYDWQSSISGEPGYELVNCEKIKNVSNSKWPKWSIIVDYKRYK